MIRTGFVHFLLLLQIIRVFDDLRRSANALVGDPAEQHVPAGGHEVLQLTRV